MRKQMNESSPGFIAARPWSGEACARENDELRIIDPLVEHGKTKNNPNLRQIFWHRCKDCNFGFAFGRKFSQIDGNSTRCSTLYVSVVIYSFRRPPSAGWEAPKRKSSLSSLINDETSMIDFRLRKTSQISSKKPKKFSVRWNPSLINVPLN